LMGRCAPGWCLLVISCTLCVCHPPTENTTSTPVVGPYEPPFFEASCDALTRIKDGLDGKGLHMAPTQKFGMLGTFDLCMYGLHNCELAARRAAQQFPQRTQSIDQYIRSVTNVSHAVEKTLSQAVREPTTIQRVREVAQTTMRVLGSCKALLEPLQKPKSGPSRTFNLTPGELPPPPWLSRNKTNNSTPAVDVPADKHLEQLSKKIITTHLSAAEVMKDRRALTGKSPGVLLGPAKTLVPLLSFSLVGLPDDIACATAVMWALEAGFRKFVVEQGSPNLRWLGNLLDGGIMLSVLALKRSDLFIVMLLSAGHQPEKLESSIRTEMNRMKTSYVDLCTLPMTPPASGNWEYTMKLWAVLDRIAKPPPPQCDLKKHPKGCPADTPIKKPIVRMLGVQDWDSDSLKMLLKEADTKSLVTPMVLRTNFDPFRQAGRFLHKKSQLRHVCASNGIFLDGYSTTTGYPFVLSPVEDPHTRRIAAAVSKSPEQILVRWALQQGVGASVSSSQKAQIYSSFKVFNFNLPQVTDLLMMYSS